MAAAAGNAVATNQEVGLSTSVLTDETQRAGEAGRNGGPVAIGKHGLTSRTRSRGWFRRCMGIHALEAGNSAAVLFKHYCGPTTEDVAGEWFPILPKEGWPLDGVV